jgi:hypothetical protein
MPYQAIKPTVKTYLYPSNSIPRQGSQYLYRTQSQNLKTIVSAVVQTHFLKLLRRRSHVRIVLGRPNTRLADEM